MTIALPKHKEAKYDKIRTDITIKLYNAESKWNSLIRRLNETQVVGLYRELSR